jgi:hypothetical protein
MPKTLVNIGLDAKGKLLLPRHALAALAVISGQAATAATVHNIDSEPTLIAELRHPLSTAAAYEVARFLQQDAIAVWDGHDGHLIGPNSLEWGPFDPSQFLTLDGGRLAPPLANAA